MKTKTLGKLDELRSALDNAHWKMELADMHGDSRAWMKAAALYHELLSEYNELSND